MLIRWLSIMFPLEISKYRKFLGESWFNTESTTHTSTYLNLVIYVERCDWNVTNCRIIEFSNRVIHLENLCGSKLFVTSSNSFPILNSDVYFVLNTILLSSFLSFVRSFEKYIYFKMFSINFHDISTRRKFYFRESLNLTKMSLKIQEFLESFLFICFCYFLTLKCVHQKFEDSTLST